MSRCVLITGALGFCARHLASRLAAEPGVRLVGLDVVQAPAPGPLDELVVGDVADQRVISQLIQRLQPDRVFHLAGAIGIPAAEVYRVNLLGTVSLLDAIKVHAPAARVLVVGSAAEYGPVTLADNPVSEEQPCRPRGAYAVSKHGATLAALDFARVGLRVVVARPFNIVGAGIPSSLVVGAVLGRVRQALASGSEPVVRIGNLDTVRDFIAVEDVVEAYVKLVASEHWGTVFNLCSGEPRTVREVIERLLSHAPRELRLEIDPALVRPDDVPVVYGSSRKAHDAFGFEPRIPLEQAIAAAWAASARM